MTLHELRREDRLYTDLVEAAAELATLCATGGTREQIAQAATVVADLERHLKDMADLMDKAGDPGSDLGIRAARIRLLLNPEVVRMYRDVLEASRVYAGAVTAH